MAIAYSSSSSSSSSSSCSTFTLPKYDVFLSFRGEDTRAKFTSHLHAKLIQKNIETYIDNRLSKGDEISPALIEAIQESKISVIIFSENYPSSSWCLDEVVCILKCEKELGQIVVPVFYEVEPSHVRKQQKSYEAAFAKHEERFKDRIVSEWRAALTEVASISGWDSQAYNGTESEFVEAIAKDILEKLKGIYSSSAEFKDLVGINKSVEEMEHLLCINDSTTVCFIGIWGMGGLGKTTLARVLFQRFSSEFQGCCFLANVREVSENRDGMKILENELFCKLFGEMDLDSSFAKEKLRRRKVLVVLDDVDDPNQLEFLAADHGCFGPGSRILVTTRDASVLRARADDHVYELQGLCFDDALQLFKLNAFKRNYSPTADDDAILFKRVVKYASGSPLALTILGSFLRSQRKENWEIELKRLEEFPHQRIHNVLKISFDALESTGQDIFLDIVCLFSYKRQARRKLVERRLGAHRSYVEREIDSLIDKSLITHVKDSDTLVIHDLLKDMGWEIERQRVKESGKHSRLWQEEQLFDVFQSNTGNPSAVEGISCSKIDWERRDWSPTMFKGMDRLWLLNTNCSGLDSPQDLEYLPESLKCLQWNFWPWKSLPSNFMAHNLVELRMKSSKLEQLWSGVQLGNLKYVNIRSSKNLIDVSALSQAPNLVKVDLTGCSSLRQVPPLRFQTSLDQSSHGDNFYRSCTLGCLLLDFCTHLEVVGNISGNLKKLSLSYTSIKELPSSIWSLDDLEYLNLRFCHDLESLSSDIQKLKSLRRLILFQCYYIDKLPVLPGQLIELDLSMTELEQVPSSSIEHLSSLEKLSLSGCRRLKSLPIGICRLKSLKRLDLGYCYQLEIFSATLEYLETLSLTSICNLSSLEELRLNGIIIEGIPVCIKNLSKLIKLVICRCYRLKSLPELPSSLELLDARDCTSLETISNSRDALIHGLKSGNHVMTYKRFVYLDCLRLDQNSRNNLVSEFQLRALDTGIKAVLPYSALKKSDHPGVGICFPGNEIPKWFTYQSKSSSINVKLPSNWQNTNFLGIAFCALTARRSISFLKLFCDGNFKTNDGKSWKLKCYFNHEIFCANMLQLSNIFMWYELGNYHDHLDAEEVSFRFYEKSVAANVTACGIRLLYRQDAEELGIYQ